MYLEIMKYCKTCAECQQTAPGKKGDRAPLIPMPVIAEPFSRIAMDVVGPLERSSSGNRFILVIGDYATKYVEAFPLRKVKSRQVVNCLIQLFSRVGVPREIISDQGTNLTSKFVKEVYRLLGIKGIRTTPYHPQTDGMVERFNKTLKAMLRKFVSDTGADWDQWLPFLLFAYREVPQATTGFSPFDLLYGHHVRGPLDILKEAWEGEQPAKQVGVMSYVLKMRDKLEQLTDLAHANIETAQSRQKQGYDRRSKQRTFQPGQKVLLLLPSSESSLLAKWQGPFEVTRKMGPVTYELSMPERRKKHQTFHVNLLREWKDRNPLSQQLLARVVTDEEETEELYFPASSPSFSLPDVSHLVPSEQKELKDIIPDGLFSERPGRTDLVTHDIHLLSPETAPIRQSSYRIPATLVSALKKEVGSMLDMGIIEPCTSQWCSPVVLVPKKDSNDLRFCINFIKVNSVSAFDPYPMPRVDELIERLGKAKYLTTLDLCKGYWQIPLTERAKDITAFRVPSGLYRFTMMPFGLHGAAATFQRLMDSVLRGAEAYSAAYIDDVIIYSSTWEEHLQHLSDVFQRIQQAGLVINAKKCQLVRSEVKYLGYVIGGGEIRPQLDKIAAVQSCPPPKTKRQVRQFLGLTGWYRRYIDKFSDRAAPLTALTRKSCPVKVKWTPACEEAFQDLKQCLCQDPVLQSPDYSLPFTVQTDASEIGLGAVLLQGKAGDQKPVLYVSRKLYPRETRYSTIEKEALAIKWALDTLRYYILGKDFVLETDHRALQWIHRMRDANGRIARWYLSLQPYRFTVKYRAGKDNVVADFLSRKEK